MHPNLLKYVQYINLRNYEVTKLYSIIQRKKNPKKNQINNL